MRTNDKEALIGQLKEKGLKITPQRAAIIEALVKNRYAHPGATMIFTEARKKAKHVSLSTVYATLKEFSENGLIKQLEFDRMENRYERRSVRSYQSDLQTVAERLSTITSLHLLNPETLPVNRVLSSQIPEWNCTGIAATA